MRRFVSKYTHTVIPRRFKLVIPITTPSLEWSLRYYDEVEVQILAECYNKGVPQELHNYYLAFGKRVFKAYTTTWLESAEIERAALIQEFTLRDLNPTVLVQIADLMFIKAGLAREICVHPDYVCWFNSCEEITDWEFEARASGSIVETPYKECYGAIQIELPQLGVGTIWARIPEAKLNACDEYFGFWTRRATTGPSNLNWYLHGQGAFYEAFYLGLAPNFDTFFCEVNAPQGKRSANTGVTMQSDVWYWLEVRHYFDGTTWRTLFYINGSVEANFAGWGPIGPFRYFRTFKDASLWAETIYIDYVRFADRFEYEPQ